MNECIQIMWKCACHRRTRNRTRKPKLKKLIVNTFVSEEAANRRLERILKRWKRPKSLARLAHRIPDRYGKYQTILPTTGGDYDESILVGWWSEVRTSNAQSCFDWMTDRGFKHLLHVVRYYGPLQKKHLFN